MVTNTTDGSAQVERPQAAEHLQPPGGRRPRMRRALRLAAVIATLAALAAGAVLLIQRKRAALAEAPRYAARPVPVRVTEAQNGSLRITRNYLGTVEPLREAAVSARVTAPVLSVEVDEGDVVQAGQVLLSLEEGDLAPAIAAAQAQVKQVEAELAGNKATVEALSSSLGYWQREAQRMREVRQRGAATVTETEGIEDKVNELEGRLEASRRKSEALAHQFEAARHRVSELQTRLAYYTIRSPFAATVTRRHVDPGDLASPGKALLLIEDTSSRILAFEVPQQDITQVRKDMPLQFAGPDGPRQARIDNLHPALDSARMLRIEAVLQGEQAAGLESGAYVPIQLVLDQLDNVTFVPDDAIAVDSEGRKQAFVVQDGTLERRRIREIGRGPEGVAVEGLESGETVVLSRFLDWANLSQGRRVEVLP